MVFCPACGIENPEDSAFCKKCGASVRPPAPGTADTRFEENVIEFARDMEQFGRKAARKAEQFARRFINEVDRQMNGTSVCPRCEATFSGVHDYCSKCGARIE